MTVYFVADTPFNRAWYAHLIGYGYERPVPYAGLEITETVREIEA
jgi:hypothetical protein